MTVKSWKVVLYFGIPWALFMVIFGTLLQGSVSYLILVCSITAGAFAGWVFSILLRYATSSLYGSIVVEILGDETLIRQGGAHRFFEKTTVGGKLVLTEKQLIFKSHMMNSQTHQYVIYLGQIESVKLTRSFGFLGNGLCVVLRNGESHRFIIGQPRPWLTAIESQILGTEVRMRKSSLSGKRSVSTLTN